ncbi:MAG: M67 family metallopeptidase [Bacillota bacterium]|nr:M67 family metallopeptidase [Bacillota bacterium]
MKREPAGNRQILYVPEPVWEAVLDHCRREMPREACGLLSGLGNTVACALPLPNVAPDPQHSYLAEPECLYRALAEVERRGEEMLGIYHSHPTGSPALSARDREQALWPGVVHVVVSFAGRRPQARAWRLPGCGPPVDTAVGAVPLRIIHLDKL